MKALLALMDTALRDRQLATASLCFSLATWLLVVIIWALQLFAMFSPSALIAYHPARLSVVQWLVTAQVVLQLVVAVMAWRHRDGPQADSPVWAWITLGPAFVIWLILSVGYGLKDTPMGMVLIEILVFARAFFAMRHVLPWLVVGAVTIVVSELLQVTHQLESAFLLRAPVFTGGDMLWWWSVWLRVVMYTAAAPFVALVFYLFARLSRQRLELESLVRTDALTGLYNRREFMERLEQESHRQARGGQALAVVMIDVDLFKRINDQWGHPAGDHVLASLGRLMRGSIRQDIDVAARLGGEEFALLLPETDSLGAQRVAQKLVDQLASADIRWDGQPMNVTISVGVAEVLQGQGTVALNEADHNLYAAKRQGRNRMVVTVPGVTR